MVRPQWVKNGSKLNISLFSIKHLFLAESLSINSCFSNAAFFKVFVIDKVAFIFTNKVFFSASEEYLSPSALSFSAVS